MSDQSQCTAKRDDDARRSRRPSAERIGLSADLGDYPRVADRRKARNLRKSISSSTRRRQPEPARNRFRFQGRNN